MTLNSILNFLDSNNTSTIILKREGLYDLVKVIVQCGYGLTAINYKDEDFFKKSKRIAVEMKPGQNSTAFTTMVKNNFKIKVLIINIMAHIQIYFMQL